jgi:hypothetical protein
VRGAGHDDELVFGVQVLLGLPVELEHDRVAAAHDQESRSAYSRESISGEIRPPATGDDGVDLARPLGRGDEGAGRAGARTEQADP